MYKVKFYKHSRKTDKDLWYYLLFLQDTYSKQQINILVGKHYYWGKRHDL